MKLRLNFKKLLWGQTLFNIGLSGLFVVVLLYSLFVSMQKQEVDNLEQVVQQPFLVLESLHQQEVSGALTREQAQQKAKDLISLMRWGRDGKNYFWINSDNPSSIIMIMHPYKPQLDGKDVTDMKDKKGNQLFLDMVKVCSQSPFGSGFVNYYWQYKDDTSLVAAKISYVKDFKPWGWIVGAGEYEKDLHAESWRRIEHFIFLALFFGVGLGVVLMLISFFSIRNLTGSLSILSTRMKDLAKGEADLTKQLDVKSVRCFEETTCGQRDCPCYGRASHCWHEVGSYAHVVHCPKILSGKYKTCEECSVYANAIVTETEEISTFFNAFIGRIRAVVAKSKQESDRVSHEASSMAQNAEEMEGLVNRSRQMAQDTSQHAGQAGDNASSIASAMEEMTATISEVASRTAETSAISQKAYDEAVNTQHVIDRLVTASNKISDVSNLIGSIAEQTNLLALNATIEAARAGEAGKGFAVVANEVKELAKQTANSVTEINDMIGALQGESDQALNAVNSIVGVIEQVSQLSGNVAAAVEEQTAVINDVSQNVQVTNGLVQDMVSKNSEIAENQTSVFEKIRQVSSKADELQGIAKDLEHLLAEFRT